MESFWMILIGLIAGSLAGQFMTGKGFGVVGDIITGMVGALIGGLLFERTGLFAGSRLVGSLLVAVSGAIIFLYGIRVPQKGIGGGHDSGYKVLRGNRLSCRHR